LIDCFNQVWKRPPNEIEPHGESRRGPRRRPRGGDGRRLDLFEQMLVARDHLMGDQPSAADTAAFPFLEYAALPLAEDDELFHRILRGFESPGDTIRASRPGSPGSTGALSPERLVRAGPEGPPSPGTTD